MITDYYEWIEGRFGNEWRFVAKNGNWPVLARIKCGEVEASRVPYYVVEFLIEGHEATGYYPSIKLARHWVTQKVSRLPAKYKMALT